MGILIGMMKWMPWLRGLLTGEKMTTTLRLAIEEYQAAYKALPRNMEAGWVDDFQRRKQRYVVAVNALLEAAQMEDLAVSRM